MVRIIEPICLSCRHLTPAEGGKLWACEAFGDEIPGEVLAGRNRHLKPYPGDNGVQFEPIEGAEA